MAKTLTMIDKRGTQKTYKILSYPVEDFTKYQGKLMHMDKDLYIVSRVVESGSDAIVYTKYKESYNL